MWGFRCFKLNNRIFLLLSFFISASLFSVWLDHLERHFYGVKPAVSMEGQDLSGLLPGEVTLTVQEMALQYQRMPLEATLDKETGEIIDDQDGVSVNVESSVKKVMAARENQCLELDKYAVHARHRSDQIQKANKTLAYYQTWLSGTYQRYSNIGLATASINNILVWPGQIFSFNGLWRGSVPGSQYDL